jgi:competence protein ComEC
MFNKYTVLTIILGCIIVVYVYYVSSVPNEFELFVFDTDGKPSIFIRTPEDVRVLINGGSNSGIIRYLTKVLPFYSRRIDKVVLTSDNGNETSGLIDLINRYGVGSIIIPKVTSKNIGVSNATDKIFETFMDTVGRLKIPITKVERGDFVNFGTAKAEILFPVAISTLSSSSYGKEFVYSKASSPQLIMRVVYGDTSFLLLGDASLKLQKHINGELINSNAHSDVLIIPHNVSSNSVSLDLINNVKPNFVIYTSALSTARTSLKDKIDPLYMVLRDQRFNTKSKNTIKVLSDGKSVKVIQ